MAKPVFFFFPSLLTSSGSLSLWQAQVTGIIMLWSIEFWHSSRPEVFCLQISYISPSIWMQSSTLFHEYQTGKWIRISRPWDSQHRYVSQHRSPLHFLHQAVIWFHWESNPPLLCSIIYKSWQAQWWTNKSSLIIYAVSANFRFL